MHYMQGDCSSCALSSLASALYAIKDECAAAVVNDAVPFALASGLPPLIYTRHFMSDRRHSKGQQRLKYHFVQWKKEEHFLLLEEISPYPTLVIHTTTSMNESHCVTFCGRWIFDSNYDHALPLESQWLDFVCSMVNDSAFGNNMYSLVKHAIWFIPPPAVDEKMKNLLK